MANKLPANKNSKLSSYEGLSSLPNLAQIPEEVLGREVAAYNEHINNVLKAHAADLAPYLPLPLAEADSLVLFERVRDGVVLGHLIHELNASKISLKKLNLKIDLSTVGQNNSKALFEVNSNLDLVIQAAKDYGIVVVNIGAEDILHSHRDLVLGLVWQLVRAHLVAAVNLATHPELIRLLEKNETLPELMSLPADQILLRWFNYHLRRAGHATEIKNLSKDIADSEAYTVLMKQIAPKLVDQSKVDAVRALPKSEAEARAKLMLEIADALGCRKFVTYKDVAAGHSRLNFAFTATLFNKYIGIRLPTEEEIAAIYDELDALREKVRELTQNKRDNEAKIGLLESAIKALEDKLGVVEREKQLLKVDIEKLNRSLADETSRFEETLEAANKKHSAFRDAQAKELAAVRDLLTSHFGSDAAACPAGTTGEGDELNSQLRWFVSRLIEENLRQAKQIQDLQADKERNAKMNQIIDAKIVAVSEELIEYKKKAEKKK